MSSRVARVWEYIRRQRSYNPQLGHPHSVLTRDRITQLVQIQKILGIHFYNVGILDQALTHISYANEHRNLGFVSNEQLEFFGDAILGFLITDRLVKENPTVREGKLSKTRSFLVSTNSLAQKAEACRLGAFIRFGIGEEMSGGSGKPSLLANAYEALICAVFLDRGLAVTQRFINCQFQKDFSGKRIDAHLFDYKTKFQEFTQEKWSIIPHYQLVDTSGPEHNKRFCVALKVAGVTVGRGKGSTKKKAEQAAARMALYKIASSKSSLPPDLPQREYLLAIQRVPKKHHRKAGPSVEV